MLFDTEYKTPIKASESIYKEKGSKFIGICNHLKSVDEFKEFLSKVKIRYPGAVHYCYAYRIGYDKSIYRMNDDGEPSGTAGKPIFNTILSNNLTNVGIIVVRYFGGTLLGVPGLINAYKLSANDAIMQNNIISRSILEKVEIEFSYEQMNEAMKIIKEHQLKILKQESDDKYKIHLEIPIKNAERVRSAFEINLINYLYITTY